MRTNNYFPTKHLQMSSPVGGEGRDSSPGLADCGDLVVQRAREVRRLREAGAADYEIRPAVKALESLLRSVILAQVSLVKELRSDRAGKSLIAEAERRLEQLKAEFLTDTGAEWSDVRAEGPVLLTTNKVRGTEALAELKLELKQLTRDNVLR